MFTGIITALGKITQVIDIANANGKRVEVQIQQPTAHSMLASQWLEPVQNGDSICISGACMTVIERNAAEGKFSFEISEESLSKTTGLNRLGSLVNLEKSLRLNDFLGGHLVSGHVDATAKVIELSPIGESYKLVVELGKSLQAFVAVKGSITLNGVSLTINKVIDQAHTSLIELNLIPHTWANTNLHICQAGCLVNVEIDLLARYVERIHSTALPTR